MEADARAALQNHPDFRHARDRLNFISSGSYGAVFSVEQTDGWVAVKLVSKDHIFGICAHFKQFLYELRTHYRVSGHGHVVSLKGVFDCGRYIGITMEFCSQGPFSDLVSSFPRPFQVGGHSVSREHIAAFYFRQIILAIDYCHSQGVVHRDLKFNNILLFPNPSSPQYPLLKLCDFGFSKAVDGSYAATVDPMGTYLYLAPEILSTGLYKRWADLLEPGNHHSSRFYPIHHYLQRIEHQQEQRALQQGDTRRRYSGKATDVWACGVMLYYLLFAEFPFGFTHLTFDNLGSALLQMVRRDVHKQLKTSQISNNPNLIDLLSRMLEPDPSLRISTSEILTHCWCQSQSVFSDEDKEYNANARQVIGRVAERVPQEQGIILFMKGLLQQSSMNPTELQLSCQHVDREFQKLQSKLLEAQGASAQGSSSSSAPLAASSSSSWASSYIGT